MNSSHLKKYLNQQITIYLKSNMPQTATTWTSYQSHWVDFNNYGMLNQPIVYNPNIITGTLTAIDEDDNVITLVNNKMEYILSGAVILYVVAIEQIK